MNFRAYLTRSTKSLQLPSLSAGSVMTRVPPCADWSKPEAALMLRAHCTVTPRALNSFSMPGSGPLFATMMTALAGCLPGINVTYARSHASGAQFRIAVSYRKRVLYVCARRPLYSGRQIGLTAGRVYKGSAPALERAMP
jgi:hypothetical protein